MEADVLNALKARAAYFTGACDRHGRWVICVPVPGELQPWSQRNMELALQYLLGTMIVSETAATETSADANAARFVLLVDTQKCSSRLARSTVRHIEHIVDGAIGATGARGGRRRLMQDTQQTSTENSLARIMILVIRSDAFWDKQLVENCTKTTTGHNNSRPDEVSVQ